MAADSSMGFHQGVTSSSFYNHHMVSFQTGGMFSGGGVGMLSRGTNNAIGSGGSAGLFLPPNNSGTVTSMASISPSTSSSSGIAQNYKFVTGSPADWTLAELTILKEGLLRYAHEPNIMKYIKIAAMLPSRTIRDVALRCWWNTNKESTKRRKQEGHHSGKRTRDMKDKIAAPATDINYNMVPANNLTPFSLSAYHSNLEGRPCSDVEILDSGTRHLLEENIQLLNQIAGNVDTLKFQENMDLFFQTGNNIRAVLNRMSETPGIMCQMPPLPVSINNECLNSILQFNNMLASYGAVLNSPHLKQEQGS